MALMLNAAETAPTRPVLVKGPLRVEFDTWVLMNADQGRIVGQCQGNVLFTWEEETRKLRLHAKSITLGLGPDYALQIASARGEVHVEVDLPDPKTDLVRHLVADAEWVIYEKQEDKVTAKAPALITLTSSSASGEESKMTLTPRQKFEFWLKGMPPELGQELLSELEKATAESAGKEPSEAPPPKGGGT
jgi:hypothetical protein